MVHQQKIIAHVHALESKSSKSRMRAVTFIIASPKPTGNPRAFHDLAASALTANKPWYPRARFAVAVKSRSHSEVEPFNKLSGSHSSQNASLQGFLALLRMYSASEIRKPTTNQHLDDGKNNRGRDTEH
jgi:hypothetical protein